MAHPDLTHRTQADRVAADRDTVRALVRRVGTWRLRFSVQQIRAEMTGPPVYTLYAPSELARRLGELEDDAITRVDGTFALILATGTARERVPRRPSPRVGRGGQPGARVTHQYVLTNRLHELRAAQPEALDDLERVALAVAVATLALGGAPAPTRLITEVLTTLPDLMLQRPTQQTNVLLGRLARREIPVVGESKAGADRSARWQLVEPLKGVWLDWVIEQAAQLTAMRGAVHATAATGEASQAQIAARLVEAAMRRSASSHWPQGHPVSAREIAAYIAEATQSGTDREGMVPLAEALARQGTTLTAALQSVTRSATNTGTSRRVPLVRRVEHPRFTGLRYVPATYDLALEHAWVAWTVLRQETRRPVLDALEDEWHASQACARNDDPAVRAVGAVRKVAVIAALDARRASVDGLLAPLSTISALLSAELERTREALDERTKAWPTAAVVQRDARAALTSVGISLPDALGAPRPLVTAADMAALLPASMADDLAPSVLAATAITVRRAEVSRAGRRTRVGQGRAESLP
ncbi:MAG: hypothetical protein IT360_01100, partial [Gemmatimonadaceae bacterium]|nr:hypothetical protein [Gemmatimonadaceae bacterium]